jgi:hypothetical protein
MLISTYFRPNIHQNSPEILGVKALVCQIFTIPMGVGLK